MCLDDQVSFWLLNQSSRLASTVLTKDGVWYLFFSLAYTPASAINVDLLAIESSDILETKTNPKIDLSDLGAALPHDAPKKKKNRDTLP